VVDRDGQCRFVAGASATLSAAQASLEGAGLVLLPYLINLAKRHTLNRFAVLLASFWTLSATSAELTDADRREVMSGVISHLEKEYVDSSVGRSAAKKLRQRPVDALKTAESGPSFAQALTGVLRETTGDCHLAVEYSEKELSEDANADFTQQEMERYYGAHLNFGVNKALRMEDNIGLLELSVFPPAAMGGDTVAAAMQVVAHTDALIIDLRSNGGGGDTVALVASYLFDERRPLSGIYDRATNKTQQEHTYTYVPGARFGSKKPVFVLISKRTFSAAEALAYDLQALKRATIVGEASGGGAHPFTYKRIHPHFVLWSVTQKSVNPITGGNWQGVGVQPDVVVRAEDALVRAVELIKTRAD
jgi:peptidase S41-like protein